MVHVRRLSQFMFTNEERLNYRTGSIQSMLPELRRAYYDGALEWPRCSRSQSIVKLYVYGQRLRRRDLNKYIRCTAQTA
jgi:hypothetical protein